MEESVVALEGNAEAGSPGPLAACGKPLARWPYGRARHSSPRDEAPAIAASRLTLVYPTDPQPAITTLDLTVRPGARLALVGPNGAGKSTFLKAVAGLLRPAAGQLAIFGQDVATCRHRVAYLPQRIEIDWRFPMTVERLVSTGRYAHLGWLRSLSRSDRLLVRQTMERLGLKALSRRQVGELSGGQQQRVLLARALVQEADLLLLDEPLNGVDGETRAVLEKALDELRDEGKTVIVATHDLGRLESGFDRALFLSEGKVVSPQPDFAKSRSSHRHQG